MPRARRLHRPRALAGELVRRRRRARAGAVDDATGAVPEAWTGHQVAWRWRAATRAPSAASSTRPRSGCRCACSSLRRSSTRAGRSGCFTSTCWCCSPSACRTSASTAATSAVGAARLPGAAYLLARMLSAGFRGARAPRAARAARAGRSGWRSALVFLVGFRIGLNIVDSNVIDVGYAGVIGADRIVDGDPLYGEFRKTRSTATRTGPSTTSRTCRSSRRSPGAALGRPAGRTRRGDRVRPAHAARPVRARAAAAAGREGDAGNRARLRLGGVPVHAVRAELNANDTLVAALVVWALVALRSAPRRRRAGGCARARRPRSSPRSRSRRCSPPRAGAARRGARCSPSRSSRCWLDVRRLRPRRRPARDLRPHGRLPGGRGSPFSVWGQEPSLGWLQTAVKAARVALALLVAFVPRRQNVRQVAALGAAVLIAVQLAWSTGSTSTSCGSRRSCWWRCSCPAPARRPSGRRAARAPRAPGGGRVAERPPAGRSPCSRGLGGALLVPPSTTA